jgi:hypothetical protein
MFSIFKRKRKQCCNCKKTFYKPESIVYVGILGNDMYFEVSPCCNESYIIV